MLCAICKSIRAVELQHFGKTSIYDKRFIKFGKCGSCHKIFKPIKPKTRFISWIRRWKDAGEPGHLFNQREDDQRMQEFIVGLDRWERVNEK